VTDVVQGIRDRAKVNATLLLDSLARHESWEAAPCAELIVLGLGFGHPVSCMQSKTPPPLRLTIENEELRLKNQELEAVLEGLQKRVQEAERLRCETVVALDIYQAQLDAELRSFRTQRAWNVMLYLRKAYTVLVRGIQKGKVPSIGALVSLIFAPSKNLDYYDLRFPLLKHAIPEGLRNGFKAPAGQFATPSAIPAPSIAPHPRRLGVPRQQKYDVLILPFLEFDSSHQRPQHLAIRFARLGHRVFWISPSRTAGPDRPYDIANLQSGLWEVRLRSLVPNVYLGELEPDFVRDALACIEFLYRDFSISECCTLALLPFWRRLGLGLREAFDTKLLYDCTHDWREVPARGAFNRYEEPMLVEEADVLVVPERRRLERHRAAGRQPVLVRNAFDFERFSSAECMGYLGSISRPVVGYFGAIADSFDYQLMYDVARSRTGYSFVLVGAFGLEEHSKFAELPNVHLCGPKPYAEKPSYLAEFDVCIMPLVVNEVTEANGLVEFYEYLSQGKPVVATPMPQLLECQELAYIAATAAEFASSVDAGLSEKESSLRQRRFEFAANQSWTERARVMDQAIRKAFPLVSILIVTHNSAEYVPICLEAVLRNTSYPSYEVIIVDNASRDRTADLLVQFATRDPRLRVVRNDENPGFAAANNQAAGLANGEYLLLLNIDTIPSPGWVARLVRHCVKHPDIGLVVPVTNNIGNEAKIRVPYINLSGMEQFAIDLGADKLGETLDMSVGPLFCALLSRAVWNRVGPLDERFRIGMFEDDDFSVRIRKAGFRVVAAEDCFVHHFGQGSFAKLAPADYQEVFAMNRRLFEEKWQTEWEPHKYRPGISAGEGQFRPSDFAAGLPGE
jgi:GT2 family glycosyltransferase/glycosyltransferase involved in cell wall biosynthesis